MDKTQADAIAQAILQPDLLAQQQIRLKRAREDADLALRRHAAVFALIGSGLGALVAHYLDYRFSLGIIWGGLGGALVGWLVKRRAA